MHVFDAGNDTVGLIIVLGDLNPRSSRPSTTSPSTGASSGDKYSYVIDGLQIADLLLGKFASAVILNQGILTDRYDAPRAASPLDFQNVAAPVPINQVRQGVGFSEDDGQPFPVYGWLKVWWQDPTQGSTPCWLIARRPGPEAADTLSRCPS